MESSKHETSTIFKGSLGGGRDIEMVEGLSELNGVVPSFGLEVEDDCSAINSTMAGLYAGRNPFQIC